MSNTEALLTIADTDLAHVNGGDGNTGHREHLDDAVSTTGVHLNDSIRDGNYSLCLAANTRQARDAYPDTRQWWERLVGLGVDRNGRARADYERRGMSNCNVVAGS